MYVHAILRQLWRFFTLKTGFNLTVTEIAEIAGVSTGTVDRVIHNRGRVSEKTREKINKIISENGYSPDPIARFLKKKSEIKIGVLIPAISEESGYWKAIYDGILDACVNDYAAFGFQIELFGFKRPDVSSLKAQFNQMIKAGCSAYIIAPIMQEEIMFLLSETKLSAPYTFIDSPLPGALPITTVAQNPFKAGFLAGKLTHLCSAQNGTFAVIKPFSESYNLNERARGFASYFLQTSDCKAVQKIARGSTEEEIIDAVDKIIHEYENIRGICVVNSEVHFVGQKIEQMGLKDKISIVGFDLVDSNVSAIKEGKIDALISQDPYRQGGLAMKEIYKSLILEKDVEKEVNIPLNVFFKENIDF